MEGAVALYSGPETSHWKVEGALRDMGFVFRNLLPRDVTRDGLKGASVLVIPGGHSQRVFHELGDSFDAIRGFVSNGGGYIGISAGCLLACSKTPGNLPQGLGLMDLEGRYAPENLKIEKRVEMDVKSGHPVTRGYQGRVQVPYGWGPRLIAGKGAHALATFDEGSGAAACSAYGKGRVVVFSPHPESDKETMGLLRNAIEYAAGASQ